MFLWGFGGLGFGVFWGGWGFRVLGVGVTGFSG